MSDKKTILAQDACILFDLVDINLLDSFFRLDYVVITTPYVLQEIRLETQSEIINPYIRSGRIQIDNTDALTTIRLLNKEYKSLSQVDCSILELAERIQGELLSADKALRNAAKRRNLTVRGTLWIIEELTTAGIITVETAHQKLKDYSVINPRAPTLEIDKLIKRLQHESYDY